MPINHLLVMYEYVFLEHSAQDIQAGFYIEYRELSLF
jgi:hypothetical protein